MFTSPEFRCAVEAIGLIAILYSLLPMWIAFGRGRWSVRATIGVAAIGVLIPLQAYQPLVFFSLTNVASVLILGLARVGVDRHLIRVTRRSAAPLLRRIDFWIGIGAGTITGSAAIGWMVRVFRDIGWREHLLLFSLVFVTIVIVAMSFGDAFRLRRRYVGRNEFAGHSFRLIDFFFAMTLLAVLFALTAYAQHTHPVSDWKPLVIAAGLSTLITITVAIAVLPIDPRWRIAVAGILGIATWISASYGASLGQWLMQGNAYGLIPGAPWKEVVWFYSASLLTIAACVSQAGVFGFRSQESVVDPGNGKVCVTASVCFAVLLIVSLAPIAVEMRRPLPRPQQIEQSSAVYHQLVSLMSTLQELNPSENTLQLLRSQKKQNLEDDISNQYQLIRPVARQRFRAPDPLTDDRLFDSVVQDLAVFRMWARCVNREALGSVSNKDWNDAIEHWLDCLFVGQGLSRGSDLSYTLTGIAIETEAYIGLAQIRADLSLRQAETVLAALIEQEQGREPLESIGKRSELMLEQEMRWHYRLSSAAPYVLSSKSRDAVETYATPAIQATEDAIRRRDAAIRMLIVELAVRLFQDENDRLPDRLDELTADHLSDVPVDPFSGGPLVYRKTTTGFLVYSVGFNGSDDGGVFVDFATMYANESDFDLDTLTRPPKTASPGGMGGMGAGSL